jgi:hypothetical protein
VFAIHHKFDKPDHNKTNRYAVINCTQIVTQPIPMNVLSEVWVCSGSFDGIACSNPDGGMDVCLLFMMCFVNYRSLCRADPSSREVLASAVCLSETVQWKLLK